MIDQLIVSCSEINLAIRSIPAFIEIMPLEKIKEYETAQAKMSEPAKEKSNRQ